MISTLFTTFLYEPLFNGLVILYHLVPGHEFGIAIILLTLLLRFALYPLSAKAIIAQRRLAALQPQVKELQEKYKENKEQQAKEILDLYKKEKVNPFAGLGPLFLQLPILIALYRVFWNGLGTDELALYLYSFIPHPGVIDPSFFGILMLDEKSWGIAIAAGLFQFIQTKHAMQMNTTVKSSSDMAQAMQKQMTAIFPAVTVAIVSQLPSAIGVYWVTTSIFSLWQQWHLQRKGDNILQKKT
ncbi:MAG: YidC/Oxa1 family membrane protein insertase [bacterium]|nr:YidC/Oxa1 family membrane protein insertase [bacterium]